MNENLNWIAKTMLMMTIIRYMHYFIISTKKKHKISGEKVTTPALFNIMMRPDKKIRGPVEFLGARKLTWAREKMEIPYAYFPL